MIYFYFHILNQPSDAWIIKSQSNIFYMFVFTFKQVKNPAKKCCQYIVFWGSYIYVRCSG